MVTRRSVLRATLATSGAGLFTGTALSPMFLTGGARADAPAAAALEPFRVPMPVPRVLDPVSRWGGFDAYAMTMRPARKEILPGTLTDVLTYDGEFPGPTIRASRYRPVVVWQRNALDTPATVHLHGGEVRPEHDGQPMDLISPGRGRLYVYPNRQPNASLWYHDHAHHTEAEHVFRGLSGSYLLTDRAERRLPLPSGRYEVPITLRDARFDAEGQLVFVMNDVFNRTTLLANGKPYPYFEVAARKYRFRLLNSSNLRSFMLRLSDGGEMTQIGSDGGLLERPHTTDSVFMSAGERADVVIDFSRYPVGTRLVLQNMAGPGDPALIGQVLRFDVTERARDRSEVPRVLRRLPRLDRPTVERTIELRMDERGPDPKGYINGKVFDPDRIDTYIRRGASEVWTLTNPNQHAPHNFHMHLVQFRVLERNGDSPRPADAGLKDTVMLMPGETVKVQATFDSYRGTYLYHCHLLDHSAMGMMAQMRIR